MNGPIQPVVVAVDVRRGIEEAFRVFTAEIGAWWPVADHSVEPDRVETVVLEGRLGGRLYERWHDGGEADWARVLAWEPPARLLLSWSPNPTARPRPRSRSASWPWPPTTPGSSWSVEAGSASATRPPGPGPATSAAGHASWTPSPVRPCPSPTGARPLAEAMAGR